MNRISPVDFIWGENRNWALANKTIGLHSLASGLIGTASGCIKACTDEGSFLYTACRFIQSIAYGFRNYFQYSLYSRKDDDLGEDIHKRPYAANIGEAACFVEKKINPLALPLAFLFGKKISESYDSIAHLTNALWWRVRLCSEKIVWRDFNRKFFRKIKDLINPDINKRKLATKEIKMIITPFLGIIGTFMMGVFTPIKSFLRLRGIESKPINFFSEMGVLSQHLIYLFKFSLPQLWETQEKDKANDKMLAFTGLCANTLNIALPVIELLPSNETFLGKFQKLHRELATGFTAAFFSTRRYLLGREKLLEK